MSVPLSSVEGQRKLREATTRYKINMPDRARTERALALWTMYKMLGSCQAVSDHLRDHGEELSAQRIQALMSEATHGPPAVDT